MQTRVSLIGMGQTRFGEWWDKSLVDLLREAVHAAVDSAPCSPLEIDAIVVANMLGESLSGQAQLGAIASSLFPHHPPALRVEAACGSGAVAIHTACALLESGRAKNVLIVGAEKMTDASNDDVADALMGASHAEIERTGGLTFPGIFGLVAQRYMYEYGLTREQLSVVSAVHHRQAKANPFAQFRSDVSPEAVTKSSLIADPLTLLDCSPISDGAAACILSTAYEAPLRLAASQLATDAISVAERQTLTSFDATKRAAQKAFEEANVVPSDIDCAELHDCFSIAAVINLEDLGFAEPGTGIRIYEELLNDPERSPLSVNASGGLKACGHPVAATGVKQFIDVAKQLQSRRKRWGLSHNFGGAGATCAIHLLENVHA